MGLIQKKDEKDEIDGIQIIERGEGPDGDEAEKIDWSPVRLPSTLLPVRRPRRRTLASRQRSPRTPPTRI